MKLLDTHLQFLMFVRVQIAALRFTELSATRRKLTMDLQAAGLVNVGGEDGKLDLTRKGSLVITLITDAFNEITANVEMRE